MTGRFQAVTEECNASVLLTVPLVKFLLQQNNSVDISARSPRASLGQVATIIAVAVLLA